MERVVVVTKQVSLVTQSGGFRNAVALHARARIETIVPVTDWLDVVVALHARARIETTVRRQCGGRPIVALHARARIETMAKARPDLRFGASPSTRGRGLKPHRSLAIVRSYRRPPREGAD